MPQIPDNKEPVIYGLVDPDTCMIRYVGQTSAGLRKRFRKHISKARKPQIYSEYWLNTLLKQNKLPLVTILEQTELVNEAEVWWIAYGRCLGWPLTNLTTGGQGTSGRVVSATERQQLSARVKGDNNPAKRPEVRARISASNKGLLKNVPKTDVHKQAMRTGWNTPERFNDRHKKWQYAIFLRTLGQSTSYIARVMNISERTVRYYCNEYLRFYKRFK